MINEVASHYCSPVEKEASKKIIGKQGKAKVPKATRPERPGSACLFTPFHILFHSDFLHVDLARGTLNFSIMKIIFSQL